MVRCSAAHIAAHFHALEKDVHFFAYVPKTGRICSTLLARKGWTDERIKYSTRSGILFSFSHGGRRHQFRHIRTLAFGTLWGRISGGHQEHFKNVRTVFTLIFEYRHYLLRKRLMGNLDYFTRPYYNTDINIKSITELHGCYQSPNFFRFRYYRV